jgi:hypothetical protein
MKPTLEKQFESLKFDLDEWVHNLGLSAEVVENITIYDAYILRDLYLKGWLEGIRQQIDLPGETEILSLHKIKDHLEIRIGEKSTGGLMPDEALGFIAHKLFRKVERENLFSLKEIKEQEELKDE